jgi:mRNA-degrading endonuclease RelE of RelBE toxin-antitoxin system
LVWKIDFQAAAIKQLKKMGHAESTRIRDFLRDRVKPLDDPRQLGAALQGSQFKHLWRYKSAITASSATYRIRSSSCLSSKSAIAGKSIANP